LTDELLKWRSEFPILDKTVYLISHSLGAMPKATYDRMQDYAETWATLKDIDGERERVCAYLRAHHPHLLKVYDAEFLGAAIVELKARQAATAAHLARAANDPRH